MRRDLPARQHRRFGREVARPGSRAGRAVAAVSTAAVVVAGLSLGAASPASATQDACPDENPALLSTASCEAAGSSTLTVPAGTTDVDVDIVGGGGGAGYPARQHIGGNAAEVTGNLTLPAGTAYLDVIVGTGGGGNNHGYGYGGRGSGVFALDSSENLIAKLAIAGAGGGGAYNGDGGNAGSPGTSENAGLAGPGQSGVGAVGGSGGVGNYSSGTAGGSNNPTSASLANGGNAGTYPNNSAGGSGGGGYGGGGGGATGNQGILTIVQAGGGGGSSLASAYLGAASISIKPNTGGIQLPGLVAGDGATGSVSLTFNGLAVPSKPTGVSATPGNHQASIAFTAPAGDGGSPITSYTVTSSPGGITATCPGSPCVLTGLTNGTDYTFTVHATNANGDSQESSASASVTPAQLPGAPTDVSAAAGAGQASVSFAAPASDGGSSITGYTVTSSPGNKTATCPGSPCVVTGLTNGTTYTFSVQATNAIGDSTSSTNSAEVTPLDVPGSPTNVSAQPGHHRAVVSFNAPAHDGGTPITHYEVISDPDGINTTCPDSPCTLTGLTDGTAYTFKVVAYNSVGDGDASDASTAVTPADVPGAPTAVSATAGGGQAEVIFTAPGDDGGSAITSYTVTSEPDDITATCPGSPCTITGLDNGTEYTFTVHATSAIGDSLESAASSSVTPSDVPNSPGDVSLTPGDQHVGISFPAPDANGAAITGYEVSVDGGQTWQTLNAIATNGTVTGEVGGLINGVTYSVELRARNADGAGKASVAQDVTPATTPGVPTDVVATHGNGTASVTFNAPVDDGGATITSYTVTSDPGGITSDCIGSPCLVTGLDNGTEYTFTVHATSAVGESPESAVSNSVTASGVPNSPGDVDLKAGDGKVTLVFPTPADNGAAITGYQVSTDGGLTWSTLTTQPTLGGLVGTVSGLTNGTEYDVQVRALNADGHSEASTLQHVTPLTKPGAPTDVVATHGNGTTSVSFTAPVDDGGAAITEYTVTSHPGGITSTCVGSPCVVTGLTNGTGYTFTVKAINPAGDSVDSSASGSVTPKGAPTSPGSLTLVGTTDTTAALSFTVPSSDGGSAITGYQVSTDGGLTWAAAVNPTPVGGVVTVFVTGLTPGTSYAVQVRAVNVLGDSLATTSLTVDTAPAAVDTPAAKEKTSAARVHWTESASSTTTGYTVHASPGRATCSTASRSDTSCVIGATAGVAYTYTVVAHSSAGDSKPSEASGPATAAAPVAPRRVPHGVPTTLTTTKGKVGSVRRGQRLTLVGSGFLPRSSVVVVVYSRPIVLGTPVTNAHGRFTQRVTVPRSLSKVRHNFMAFGVDTEGAKMRMRLSVAMADRTESHHRAPTAR